MRGTLALLAGTVLLAPSVQAQKPAKGRACLFALDRADRRLNAVTVFANNQNFDVAGNVQMHCQGQPVYMTTDSVSVISGDFFRAFGHAVYRDPSYRIDADTIYYTRRIEKIEARGHVIVYDKQSGSTLRGPSVDYLREVKGINDSASVLAMQRPTVRYFTRTAPLDTITTRPYNLTGDVLHGFGQSRLWGNGSIVLTQDSVRGVGDSLSFVRGKVGTGRLMGDSATLRRAGNDSFTVAGKEIRLGLVDDRIHELRSFRDARVRRGVTDVRGDTIVMGFTSDKLSSTLAWARKTGATLHSTGYDVKGDSLAFDTPGEVLHEVRVFVDGMIVSPRDTSGPKIARVAGDSTPPDSTRNTLWGDRMVARFAQIDSAGVMVTRLRGLQSIGDAKSLFSRTVVKNGKTSPSINYTRADTILVKMNGGDSAGVASVQAYGHVDGVQLETASLKKSRPDSTAKPAIPIVVPHR